MWGRTYPYVSAPVEARASAGAFCHPHDYRADGVRPGVPEGFYLGPGGDGGGQLGVSAVCVATHRGLGGVLDGVVGVPFALDGGGLVRGAVVGDETVVCLSGEALKGVSISVNEYIMTLLTYESTPPWAETVVAREAARAAEMENFMVQGLMGGVVVAANRGGIGILSGRPSEGLVA